MEPVNINGGAGGDVRFLPGKGAGGEHGYDGSIIFEDALGREWLRLGPGDVATVRGEPVATRQGIYDAFCGWLWHATGFRDLASELHRADRAGPGG